ncbi:MAG: prephenate dehydrogenase [Campylobacteraceae bacterium 4484_4]|nr:MAG: prephenate dehydrogenase [Campylobacteraceae bacterium 4484_4]
MTIGIVGLGLMGGSMGLALKAKESTLKILGYDLNEEHAHEALKLGLVDRIASFEEIKKADIIVLATPVEAVIRITQELENIDSLTTIIDLGSTKEKIVSSIPPSIRKNFVAAHPMAGIEKFGPKAAFAELFQNHIVVLCNIEESGSIQQERSEWLFQTIGMEIVYMDARAHDLHAAYISHLPHAISYALANSVLKQEDPKSILILAAGGFRDMSRIAKSSPQMWSDIFKQNRENLLLSLDAFEKEVTKAREMIEKEKWKELEAWMENATTLHKIL